jgi:hypothetical protein
MAADADTPQSTLSNPVVTFVACLELTLDEFSYPPDTGEELDCEAIKWVHS